MNKSFLSLSLLCVAVASATESFEDAAASSFKSLETSVGTFKALSAAEVIDSAANDGSQSLCLLGGKNKSLELVFAKPLAADSSLSTYMGIPASKGAALVKAYAVTASGDKVLIDSDKKLPAGKISKKVNYQLPAGTKGLVWVISSNVKAGVAFDDFEFSPIEWSYEGAAITQMPYFPILAKGQINPVAYISVPENLDVTSISLKVSPAEAVDKVHLCVGSPDGATFAARQLYLSASPSKTGAVVFHNETNIPGGSDPVWICITPSEEARIGGEIKISDIRVASGKDECKSLQPSSQKIGVMLAPAKSKVERKPVKLSPKERKALEDQPPVPDLISNYFMAPSLVSTGKGSLLAAFDARYSTLTELRNNTDIVTSRSDDGGQTWSPVTIGVDVGEGDAFGCSRPCMIADARGRVTMGFGALTVEFEENTHEGIVEYDKEFDAYKTSQCLFSTSANEGESFSEKFNNPTEKIAKKDWMNVYPSSGTGIYTAEGVYVMPAVITTGKGTGANDFHACLLYSVNNGKSWAVSEPLPVPSSFCQVVELKDGSLMLNAQDPMSNAYRLVYTTKDLGKTWKEHESNLKALHALSGQCALLRVKSKKYGDVLLFASGEEGSAVKNTLQPVTSRMTVRYSKDDGKSWSEGFVFDDRAGISAVSMAMVGSDSIALLYAAPRGVDMDGENFGLAFLKISLSEVMSMKKGLTREEREAKLKAEAEAKVAADKAAADQAAAN